MHRRSMTLWIKNGYVKSTLNRHWSNNLLSANITWGSRDGQRHYHCSRGQCPVSATLGGDSGRGVAKGVRALTSFWTACLRRWGSRRCPFLVSLSIGLIFVLYYKPVLFTAYRINYDKWEKYSPPKSCELKIDNFWWSCHLILGLLG